MVGHRKHRTVNRSRKMARTLRARDPFLLAWPPLLFVLHVGNFELLILALAMLGWRAAAAGRDVHAGLWLGIAAAIKLYPILLLVPFVVRWRVRLLMAAGLVIILSQLGGLVTVGISGMVRYYGEILPAVSAKYQHLALNTSPYGALLRWFGGATNVEPLLHAPGVVLPVTIAISLFALLALARLEPEAAPVAILVALPAVWGTYVTLALPQIIILLRSPSRRRAALLAAVAASVTLPWVVNPSLILLSQLMRLHGSAESLAYYHIDSVCYRRAQPSFRNWFRKTYITPERFCE